MSRRETQRKYPPGHLFAMWSTITQKPELCMIIGWGKVLPSNNWSKTDNWVATAIYQGQIVRFYWGELWRNHGPKRFYNLEEFVEIEEWDT